jgi:hypothetical protein
MSLTVLGCHFVPIKGRGGRFVPLLSPPEGHPPLWELWSPSPVYIIICSKYHRVFKKTCHYPINPKLNPFSDFSKTDPPPPYFYPADRGHFVYRKTPRQWYLDVQNPHDTISRRTLYGLFWKGWCSPHFAPPLFPFTSLPLRCYTARLLPQTGRCATCLF